MRIYAPILKAEENDDGTLTVEGIASSESEDAAGETVTAAAIKAALPAFMRHGTGALREQHDAKKAAGTVDSASVNAEGLTVIAATVVDEVAIRKVRKGVYKGFSIGGRVLKRDSKNPKIVTALSLTEISLVDRPANPDAVLTMWKADGPEAWLDSDSIRRAYPRMSAQERARLAMWATHKLGGVEMSARV